MKFASLSIVTALFFGSITAFAGGAGTQEPPKQGLIRLCEGVSGNVKRFYVYHTGPRESLQTTLMNIDLVEIDLSYHFEVSKGVNRQVMTGVFESYVVLDDPKEVLGGNGAAPYGPSVVEVTQQGANSYLVQGEVTVEDGGYPSSKGRKFEFSGEVVCK